MAILSEAGIENLIERYKKSYLDNPSFLLSGYSQENQTVADYEGRQLLELIQNADDAESDVVYISLDTLKNELKVSNEGDAFSLEGVESLMYTGLSTKNKFEYIGNKGLGFRSILSWVNWVEVRTKEVGFRFSKEYSVRYFEEHLQDNALIKERIEKEIAEKRLSKNEIPIATLAFPEPRSEKEAEYTTSIVLQFKEGQLTSIEEQLALIKEETLLFLPNIKKIVVVKDGAIINELHKTIDSEQLVKVNDKTWNVFRVADQAYDDNVKFNYTIAWLDSLESSGYFYNYFKTDVPTALPCIIHATFNLTNNRKEINDNKANKHILNCVVASLAEIVTTRLKIDTPNWDAYSFLTPSNANSRDHFKEFYKKIVEKREDSNCYPGLDGKYMHKEDAIYQGEAFSKWVLQNDFGKYFPNLLLPVGSLDVSVTKPYPYKEWIAIINDNSINSSSNLNSELDLNNRVALLKLILDNESGCFDSIINSDNHLPLLLDVDNNVVSEKKQVFTNDVKDAGYDFPDYIQDISFISHELYGAIKEGLKEEIKEKRIDSDNGDSRAIKRLLDDIVNIGSDDIIVVIQHIVRKTNEKIKSSPNPKKTVLEMVHSLFSIFNSNKERRGNLTTIKNIPLLSRAGNIVRSDELYFGEDYSIGKFAEQIFEGIRLGNDYLADTTVWKLEASEEVVVSFFQWLNVNLYSKVEEIEEDLDLYDQDEFVKYIFDHLKPDMTNVKKEYSGKTISGIEDILKHPSFSLERLIAWIAKDEFFMQRIHLNNEDRFSTSYNRNKIDYKEKPSYLTFQIYKSDITNNVIASIPVATFGKIKTIDREDPLLSELKNHEIERVLDLLQIKKSFNELKPKLVYFLLNEFGSKNNITNSQQVYKLFYEYFKENENTQLRDFKPDFSEMHYWCRKGGIGSESAIQPASKVYYSDNKQLPQKILDRYWFINLPKRIGENRVSKFFGVKLIKDVVSEIHIAEEVENRLNAELTNYLNSLKVYMLSYRLESLKQEDRKEEAVNSIKALKVQLYKKAKFKLGEESYSELQDYEFVPQGSSFLLKYSDERSIDNLRQDSEFCDAIAEMVCITFKVNENKNIYRRIFKDGIKDTRHILKVDEKLKLLEEAKKLLGVSDDEKSFWREVLNIDFSAVQEAEHLRLKVEAKLDVPLPYDYARIDFSNLGSSSAIGFLKWLKIVRDFNLEAVLKETDLNKYHQENTEDAIRDIQPSFEKLLWHKANESNNISDKTDFFYQVRKIETVVERGEFTDFINDNKYELAPNYEEAVYHYILQKFSVDLKSKSLSNIKIENKYKELFKGYTFGDSIEDMEKIINEAYPKKYSLLYFEGFENEIKETLELQQADLTKDIESNLDKDEIDTSNLKLLESDMRIIKPSSNGRFGRKGGAHTSKGGRKKAFAGKREEDKVVALLEANGYEVRHKAKVTDSKHYDVEYKKDGEAWRFLEVKKDSGGYFFMSEAQKRTATSIELRDKYDLAIVKENNIHLIKSPFNFNKEEETFQDNDSFYAEPTEFRISFKVE